MELLTVGIDQVIPYANNPRSNFEAVEAVAESIKECGYCAPIVVDENMVVMAGHTRLLAMKSLGEKEIQVAVKRGLTETQKRKYRLLDNKTSEFASWDFDALRQEAQGLDFSFDFGIDDLLEKGQRLSEPVEKKMKTSKVCTCPRCNHQWEE